MVDNLAKLVSVKKIEGARLSPPGDAFAWVQKDRTLWDKLKAGEVIKIPQSDAVILQGIRIVKDKPVKEVGEE